MAPRDGILLPASQHAGAAVPAFPPSQVMARRAVRLAAGRAMPRTPFGRGDLFRIVAVRASDDLDTVTVGPGQGSAAAVLLAAALGTGGCRGHAHAFRCRASREQTGRIGRLPGKGWAQALCQRAHRQHGVLQQHRVVLRDAQALTRARSTRPARSICSVTSVSLRPSTTSASQERFRRCGARSQERLAQLGTGQFLGGCAFHVHFRIKHRDASCH